MAVPDREMAEMLGELRSESGLSQIWNVFRNQSFNVIKGSKREQANKSSEFLSVVGIGCRDDSLESGGREGVGWIGSRRFGCRGAAADSSHPAFDVFSVAISE